ncbi:MAG: glutamate racemase [Polaromonas sp.]
MTATTASIGVFDSGIGGLSVLKALRAELPNERFIYIADSGHAPYGERDDAHVVARSMAITAHLVKQNIKALVVACNTATAAAIDVLRAAYPTLPIIGVEPALKPAVALSKTKHIAVMATRSTLASARFAALLAAQNSHARFTLLPCDGLAEAIEQSVQNSNAIELVAVCARIIKSKDTFSTENKPETRIDTIVLGCTHYPFAAQQIAEQAGQDVQLIDTGEAVARQTRQRLGLAVSAPNNVPSLEFISTGHPATLRAAACNWLGLNSQIYLLQI